MATIQVPRELGPESTAAFLLRVETAAFDGELALDFSACQSTTPFGILLAAGGLRRLVNLRRFHGLMTYATHAPQSTSRYLSSTGFFEFIGLKPGEVEPTIYREPDETFLSISAIPLHSLEGTEQPIQSHLDFIAQQVAVFITKLENDPISDMLGYCLREAARNAFEHGGVDNVFYLVSLYKGGVVEIAVMDEGSGIPASLRKVFSGFEDRALVDLALRPGITEYQGPETDNKWQNSGFGLYVLSELGKKYGTFSISSGGWLITLQGKKRIVTKQPFLGTLLRLRIRIPDPEYFPNIRAAIVERGELEARATPGARRVASKGSRGNLLWD